MTDAPKPADNIANPSDNKPVVAPTTPAAPVKAPGDAEKPSTTVTPAPPKS